MSLTPEEIGTPETIDNLRMQNTSLLDEVKNVRQELEETNKKYLESEQSAKAWSEAYWSIGRILGDDDPEAAGLDFFAQKVSELIEALKLADQHLDEEGHSIYSPPRRAIAKVLNRDVGGDPDPIILEPA